MNEWAHDRFLARVDSGLGMFAGDVRGGAKLVEDRAGEHLFDIVESAGDIRSVKDTMVVNELDHHRTLGGDWSESQCCRQRRDRMERLGTERTVTRQPESAEALGAFETGDIERRPPKKSPDRARETADRQHPAIDADLFERLMLVEG